MSFHLESPAWHNNTDSGGREESTHTDLFLYDSERCRKFSFFQRPSPISANEHNSPGGAQESPEIQGEGSSITQFSTHSRRTFRRLCGRLKGKIQREGDGMPLFSGRPLQKVLGSKKFHMGSSDLLSYSPLGSRAAWLLFVCGLLMERMGEVPGLDPTGSRCVVG